MQQVNTIKSQKISENIRFNAHYGVLFLDFNNK